MEAIVVDNVTKILRGNRVLDGVSLRAFSGSILGIAGRNGAGKSMLLKAISGLMPVNTGSIRIMGRTIGRNGAFPADIGILIERPGFLPQYSALKNLHMIAEIRNRIDDRTITEMMTAFGLDPKDRRPMRKYSLGMKQKVGILQAVMEQPKVILLDEPTNNLDQESISTLQNMMKHLRDQGATILLCSHNMEDITSLCDAAYTMTEGRIEGAEEFHA